MNPEVLLAFLGIVALWLKSIIENRKRREEVDQIQRASDIALKKYQAETELAMRKTREEAEAQQSKHQLGLASQLAEHVQTLMDDSNRKMNLLEQQHALNAELTTKNKTLIEVVNKHETTNAQRLIIEQQQAEATAANTTAIHDLREVYLRTLAGSLADLQTKINADFQAWMEGLRSSGDMAQAIQIIRDLPPTLNNTEKALVAVSEKMDKLPDRTELRSVLEDLRNHFDESINRILAKLEDSPDDRETDPEAVDRPVAQP